MYLDGKETLGTSCWRKAERSPQEKPGSLQKLSLLGPRALGSQLSLALCAAHRSTSAAMQGQLLI